MPTFEGKHLFLKIFMLPIFFDEYHVLWRSCTVRVDNIVPVKNYEVHVLISLTSCNKGRFF